MTENIESNKELAQVQPNSNYILPAWRLNEIAATAIKMLCDAKYYADDFDYKKMIADKGIVIKGYSEFVPENLERMKSCSKSFWSEGLCLVIPSENKEQKEAKLICYNDSYTHGEETIIILHEYGHISLKHTEQSINGEMEATCFAISMLIMLALEHQFHFARTLAENGAINQLIEAVKTKETA